MNSKYPPLPEEISKLFGTLGRPPLPQKKPETKQEVAQAFLDLASKIKKL